MNRTTVSHSIALLLEDDNNTVHCANDIPTTAELLGKNLPHWARIFLGVLVGCCVLSLAVFIEQVVFLSRHFKAGARLNRTIWILAIFPVYTVTSFMAVVIPRSGTVVDLVAHAFFSSVIYQLVQLMVSYLGGPEGMWTVLGETREISLRTPPVCCCCFCIPTVKLNRKSFARVYRMVLQFTIIRPLLFFIAAVLWTNKSYIPGYLVPTNGFLYIAVANLLTTGFAMWGLLIMRRAFSFQLDSQYRMSGKVFCIQLTLLATSVVNILCAILVLTNAITCNSLMSKKARGDELYHMVLTVLGCVLGVLARAFFHRESDAHEIICGEETHHDDHSDHHPSSPLPAASAVEQADTKQQASNGGQNGPEIVISNGIYNGTAGTGADSKITGTDTKIPRTGTDNNIQRTETDSKITRNGTDSSMTRNETDSTA